MDDNNKDVIVVKPPFLNLVGRDPGMGDKFPDWIPETMVGLKLTDVGVNGESGFNVLPDDLIEALRAQKPHTRSEEAALWLDNWVDWAGSWRLAADDVQLLNESGEVDEAATEKYRKAAEVELQKTKETLRKLTELAEDRCTTRKQLLIVLRGHVEGIEREIKVERFNQNHELEFAREIARARQVAQKAS